LQPAGIELSLNSKAYRQDGGHVFREMRLFFNVLRVEGASKRHLALLHVIVYM
jgi:hypothetical protein